MSLPGERINKQRYNQITEGYSALKRYELSNHGKTWRNFKCILLREGNSSEKATYYIYDILGKAHYGNGKRISDHQGVREKKEE